MDQLLRRANTDEPGNPGSFGTHQPSAPGIQSFTPTLSAQDTISAEVLARCPDAVSWTAHPQPAERGHEFRNSIDVHFAGGGTIQFEPHQLTEPEIVEMIAQLTFEKQPGHHQHEVVLAAFKAGARERVGVFGPRPTAPLEWKAALTAALREDHPDLLAIVIATQKFDDGYYWATSGTGRAALGKYREVDLTDYDDLLTEAAVTGDVLGQWSLATLDLRS